MAEDASESEYIPFKRKRLDSPEDKKSDDEKHIILNITDSIADAKDQTGIKTLSRKLDLSPLDYALLKVKVNRHLVTDG